mgnify:FL=1
MEPYINADLSHPFARVSIEEAYSEDEHPSQEMRAAELEAMGYDLDTADTGSGEVVIPAHAFK